MRAEPSLSNSGANDRKSERGVKELKRDTGRALGLDAAFLIWPKTMRPLSVDDTHPVRGCHETNALGGKNSTQKCTKCTAESLFLRHFSIRDVELKKVKAGKPFYA